jgi:aspartyl protease family protein
VTLTANDALRLGLTPTSLNYDLKMNTANGESRAARVKLASVSVAGAQLQDVDAVVVENGLQTSLLGMTYLGRLSRIEATPTTLVLRP